MIPQKSKNDVRKRVHSRIRRKMVGTPQRPRLNVYRSLNNIYAQLIDDVDGATLASVSSLPSKKDGGKKARKEAGAERANSENVPSENIASEKQASENGGEDKKDHKKSAKKTGGNLAAARQVGAAIAQRAKEKGINKVVFDRGGYLYHGRIKALADAAREAGLEF